MPEPSFDPVQVLHDRFAAAIAAAFPEAAGADPVITPSKNSQKGKQFGDFQANAAMSLGKQLGKNPREVAAAIVAKVDVADIAEPLTAANIAGPGFINITLRSDALAGLLARLATPTLGITPAAGADKQTVVVDLCGVNLAKEMHVGHLRATVIGDTLARVQARLGHTVIRQNHVGDWGLPIAMVTARVQKLAKAGRLDMEKMTLADLDAAYKAAQRECAGDEKGLEYAKRWHMGPKVLAELEAQVGGANEAEAHAKATLIKLQAHDPEVYAVWERIADVTMRACLAICKRLNAIVLPEHTAGESSYSTELADLVADLVKRGIAVESEGALVVRLEDRGIDDPCLIRKSDGGFIYATTDIAAARRRVQKLGADRVIYAVDARQSLHFRQFFAAADKAGYTTNPRGRKASLEHAAFGMMLGADGRPFRTRAGASSKLSDLIDDAVEKALGEVGQKNAALSDAEKQQIASAVAVAAIRYADLSSERTKDYVFSLERMVQFEGNTGPYLLYALARIKAIFRKASEEGIAAPAASVAPGDAGFRIIEPAEKSLALSLLRYPRVVEQVGEALMPNRLTAYLYELAGTFAAFYEACHVLKAPDAPTRDARLKLCKLTERVLEDGLTLLGIPIIERM